MAKNKENMDPNAENYEADRKSKTSSVIIALIFVAVWLGVFALLIKLDVGGFASSVLNPIFKDVPIIKEVLPQTADVDDLSSYPYKNLAEAIEYIKELEVEAGDNQKTIADLKEQVADLNAEIERLKAFEDEQTEFAKIKEEFYNEVVFGDNALSYDEYKKFYESIDSENAEKLYKQVIEQYLYDEQYIELANAYSLMKPKKAAATLYEMTGDLETVVAILQSMEAEKRAAILDALSDVDSVYAAKVTVLLAP